MFVSVKSLQMRTCIGNIHAFCKRFGTNKHACMPPNTHKHTYTLIDKHMDLIHKYIYICMCVYTLYLYIYAQVMVEILRCPVPTN